MFFCSGSGSGAPALADGAVLLPGLGAGESGDGLDGGSQGAEEAGESQTSPGTKHGPAVAVAGVGAEGDDAEGSCKDTWTF